MTLAAEAAAKEFCLMQKSICPAIKGQVVNFHWFHRSEGGTQSAECYPTVDNFEGCWTMPTGLKLPAALKLDRKKILSDDLGIAKS